MREHANRILLAFIVVLTAFSIVVVWPSAPKSYLPSFIPWPRGHGLTIGSFSRPAMRLGLDLRGGSDIVVQAQEPPGFDPKNLASAMDTAIQIYNRRVNAFGLSEAQVTKEGTDKIDIQVPGITPDQAKDLIGRTALLEFKEQAIDPSTNAPQTDANGQPVWTPACLDRGCPNNETPLTGRDLKANAYVGTDPAGQPDVNFQFDSAGAKIFKAVTDRNIGKQVAIFLDNQLLSAPVVQGEISDQGQITGSNLDAKTLVAQLNAGALPLSFNVVQQSTIDASLGRDSVQKSVFAGEIGFLAVVLFMIAFYRLPGVLASLALVVYASVVLMIFKLVPVTLTLPGIAAFVLSIGIAVDANILIFERTKEELRAGRGLNSAINEGFKRAWPSIRDSNISTIMTSLILFWFGDQFGAALVKGFALNLAIGVIVSLFSAVLVTRVFLLLTVGTRLGRSRWMFGAQRPQYARTAAELETIRPQPRRLPAFLNLVGNRRWYYALSIAITIPGLISLAVFQLRPGIEFTSGTTFAVRFQQPPTQDALASTLSSYGFGNATVTAKGNDEYAISFAQPVAADTLTQDLNKDFSVDSFQPSGDGGTLKLKAPPSQAQLISFLQGHENSVENQRMASLPGGGTLDAFKDARVQGTGNDEYVVRVKELPGNVNSTQVGPSQPTALDDVAHDLQQQFGHLTDVQNRVTDQFINSDTVSAIVSHQIVQEATIAVLAASVGILLYITWAFRAVRNPFRYGASAIIALLHDVVVVVGLFSIFGAVFKTEIDTMFITGLLTVIGFSVHDTIVV
ncbi:MAG TPA: protein translocase subunit SecD, partial [Dehalococcoidia bacterium]|nr:protein translocase subunit SecD [Dehalococcoidia bacterium]